MLTAHFTTNVVQLTYTINLQKIEEYNGKVDIDHVKAAVWDKVIAFMSETLPSVANEGLALHELGNIYLDYLSEYEIS